MISHYVNLFQDHLNVWVAKTTMDISIYV